MPKRKDVVDEEKGMEMPQRKDVIDERRRERY